MWLKSYDQRYFNLDRVDSIIVESNRIEVLIGEKLYTVLEGTHEAIEAADVALHTALESPDMDLFDATTPFVIELPLTGPALQPGDP